MEMERLREARARVLAKWWVDTESALLVSHVGASSYTHADQT